MKNLKVEIPEGHTIDLERTDLEKGEIYFKKCATLPRKWKDLDIKGWFLAGTGMALPFEDDEDGFEPTSEALKNQVFPNKEDVDSVFALAQLLQLRKSWIGEWEADWDDKNWGSGVKFNIRRLGAELDIEQVVGIYYELSFPTLEMAEDFLETFRGLIGVYFKMNCVSK